MKNNLSKILNTLVLITILTAAGVAIWTHNYFIVSILLAGSMITREIAEKIK